MKSTPPLWKNLEFQPKPLCRSFQIRTIFQKIYVPDPDKIREKRVELSIWNGIVAGIELDREVIDFMESTGMALDTKFSTVFLLEFHTMNRQFFLCWI